MKFELHKNESRGHANHGWLESYHTFSFADYYNPDRMNFGKLRVLNDDVVLPAQGFGTHPHRDMEIISIPLKGQLRHKDSMGNEHIIPEGEIQIMSAGTGITHSEYNHSESEDVNFLQIWIIPEKKNLTPSYAQKKFSRLDRKNQFQSIVSPNEEDDSLKIHQEAYFSMVDLDKDHSLTYKLHQSSRYKYGIYIFLIDGKIEVAGQVLSRRDGIAISDFSELDIKSYEDSEILVMEVSL